MTQFLTPMFVMPATDDLAKECAEATEHSLVGWCDAISVAKVYAGEAKIDPNAFCSLVWASKCPERCKCIFEVLAEYAQANSKTSNAYNLLDYYVSSTKGELVAWLETIDYFRNWLQMNGRKMNLVDMLNYIGDCAQDHKGKGSLKEKLARSLDQFGVDN